MDIYLCDIDADMNLDVLGAAWDQQEVALWINIEGTPIEWDKTIISKNFNGAHEVYAIDFDQDGDLDIFGAAAEANLINWWRNDGQSPVSYTHLTLPTN